MTKRRSILCRRSIGSLSYWSSDIHVGRHTTTRKMSLSAVGSNQGTQMRAWVRLKVPILRWVMTKTKVSPNPRKIGLRKSVHGVMAMIKMRAKTQIDLIPNMKGWMITTYGKPKMEATMYSKYKHRLFVAHLSEAFRAHWVERIV